MRFRAGRLIVISLSVLVGCTSFNLANYSEPVRSAKWERAPLAVTVLVAKTRVQTREGVRIVEWEEYSSRLAGALRSTGLFSEVKIARDPPKHGLFAKPDLAGLGGCFSEPMLTVLSVGVIPYVGCADLGYRFTMEGAPLSAPVTVDTRDSVPVVWGLLAPVLYVFPNWTYRYPEREELARLRQELITRLDPQLSARH